MSFDESFPSEKSIKQAPHHKPAYEGRGMGGYAIASEQLHRWKIMGAIVLVLLAVVGYLYQTKIGAPVGRLESNVESQVVTQAPTTGYGINDSRTGVECPMGTTRVIHIENQALCCQNNICNEAQ